MKILHTSDWHLGRALYGRKRYDEFSAFLDWLCATIEKEKTDVLLISGDVFDTSTPNNRSQALYYRFLCRVSGSCCRHIMVISGNHDSPSFLNAPKELLRSLNVYVVGTADHPEDEVMVLYDDQDNPQGIVCAVPYLRDKDIRLVEPGESIQDKNLKLADGLKRHYQDVSAIARQKQVEFQKKGVGKVPIIAMGHLFTAGGKTVDGDGVRELYVGSLAHINKEIFPTFIDYLALGHLHVPQRVGGTDHIRYCGSPIPMGFGEAGQSKKVIMVEFKGTSKTVENPEIKELEVPCFQPLMRIAGSLDDIHLKIDQLIEAQSTAWLEIEYTGADIVPNLRQSIEEAASDSDMEILRIKNRQMTHQVIHATSQHETLDDLNVHDVFERCLDTYNVPKEDRKDLGRLYSEIIHALYEEDPHAE